MRINKDALIISGFLFSIYLMSVGFNQIDWVANTPWDGGFKMWDLGALVVYRWYAYFLFGIVPYTIGLFGIGWLSHVIYQRLTKKN